MKIKLDKQIAIYEFKNEDDLHSCIELRFVKIDYPQQHHWRLESVNFKSQKHLYEKEDFRFLQKVALKKDKLLEELNKNHGKEKEICNSSSY